MSETLPIECRSDNGCWKCGRCEFVARNNVEANGHESERHPMLWFCFDHQQYEETSTS